jgi:hypothetical protein
MFKAIKHCQQKKWKSSKASTKLVKKDNPYGRMSFVLA